MYKSLISIVILGGISATAMAEGQGSGRVNFTGEIISAPCSITSETRDQTIDLGQISNSALVAGGRSASKPFNITLSECNFEDAVTNRTAKITFTGNANTTMGDLLAVSGLPNSEMSKANNVAIEIQDSTFTTVTLGTALDVPNLQAGNNTLSFNAQVRGATAATAVENIPLGNFKGLANFAITYN